jgi:hypothetical protein
MDNRLVPGFGLHISCYHWQWYGHRARAVLSRAGVRSFVPYILSYFRLSSTERIVAARYSRDFGSTKA